jgi:hypothetical protein
MILDVFHAWRVAAEKVAGTSIVRSYASVPTTVASWAIAPSRRT